MDGQPDVLDGARAVDIGQRDRAGGAMWMEGEIFQPWPSSRPASAPVPSVAMPPWPFAP